MAWPIRYATTVDGATLAYQVVGDGPIDVVVSPPLAQNIELAWERPEYRRIFERFAGFSRLVHFDKRGTGASDRTVPVPGLDQRVDDLRCVMDAAGVDRAILYGLSEGGPTVLLFAATYPERVSGLVLHATAARFGNAHRTPEEVEQRRHGVDGWVRTWGTAETTMVARFAPSALDDPSYMAWQPRYERQSATPAALRDLLELIDAIDVTELLPQIAVPTLVVHRRDDGVIPLEAARQLAEAIPGARLEVVPGRDHFAHIGGVDAWIDIVERHLTGTAPASMPSLSRRQSSVEVRTLGGFSIWRDGAEVPAAEWGSRRARTLCKRLAAAEGRPVSRWQLIDTLWPDETGDDRLSARLSVQLSHVRRVLGGGVIADRESIRLDLGALVVDIDAMRLDVAAGRLADAVAHYHGDFLPDDLDAEWSEKARDRARTTCLGALRTLIEQAHVGHGAPQDAVKWAQQLLGLDPYDRDASTQLIRALDSLGQPGEAARAHQRYADRMRQLGVTPETFRDIIAVRR